MPERGVRVSGFVFGRPKPERGVRTTSLGIGLIVITLGVLFTLDNFGLVDAGQILRWWPIILVVLGLMRLTGWGSRSQVFAGALLILVGGLLLLHSLGIIHYGLGDLWPLVLVLLGLSMVGRAMRHARGQGVDDAASSINAFALWSGTDRKVVSQDFHGGDLTAIMGGHDIDLRSAGIAGGTAVIDLFGIMGGVKLRVPEDWEVSCEPLVMLGGFEDHSKGPAGEVRGHLILKGIVLMGGVEIKN